MGPFDGFIASNTIVLINMVTRKHLCRNELGNIIIINKIICTLELKLKPAAIYDEQNIRIFWHYSNKK